MITIPGHIIYLITVKLIVGSGYYITLPFLGTYMIASLAQVSFLLYTAHLSVPILWLKSIDPDTALIPGIMACGDLLGTSFLTIAYYILYLVNDPNIKNLQ